MTKIGSCSAQVLEALDRKAWLFKGLSHPHKDCNRLLLVLLPDTYPFSMTASAIDNIAMTHTPPTSPFRACGIPNSCAPMRAVSVMLLCMLMCMAEPSFLSTFASFAAFGSTPPASTCGKEHDVCQCRSQILPFCKMTSTEAMLDEF